MIDKNDVKFQAKGQWKQILLSFGFSESQLSGKSQSCPFCGGVDRFTWIEKKEKSYCRKCVNQWKDGIDMVMELNSFTFSQAMAELGDYLGLKRISNSERRKRKEERKKAEIALKIATLEAYYQAKEFEYHFYFVLTGEKYTEGNIKKLDAGQRIIRDYELKFPWVRKTERYKNEVKFWNKTMQIDARFEMLAHYTANQLMTMKNYGKSKAEISKAFNSIANKSTYGNVTLKAKVVYLMQHPELIEVYSISDLHIKNHADSICKLKTREERIKMLADVPEQYQEGVAELVAIQFKLNKLC